MIRKRWIGFAVSLAVLLLPCHDAGADAAPTEYQAKAGMIYKVAKFVTWPPGVFVSTSAPLVLCIAGNDPFGQFIDNLDGNRVQGRPLIVRRTGIDKETLQRCHLVFVGDESSKGRVLGAIAGRPILTIGDGVEFARDGGMLGLRFDKHKVIFTVNLDAARDVQLHISASLLQLATIVTSRPGR